jgi:hypothetical protein
MKKMNIINVNLNSNNNTVLVTEEEGALILHSYSDDEKPKYQAKYCTRNNPCVYIQLLDEGNELPNNEGSKKPKRRVQYRKSKKKLDKRSERQIFKMSNEKESQDFHKENLELLPVEENPRLPEGLPEGPPDEENPRLPEGLPDEGLPEGPPDEENPRLPKRLPELLKRDLKNLKKDHQTKNYTEAMNNIIKRMKKSIVSMIKP